MTGTVKFFNDQKGFGFIKVAKGKDIFFHHTAIIMEGRRFLEEDDQVEFDVVEGAKGPQAQDVRKTS